MSDTKTSAPVHPLLEGTTPGPWTRNSEALIVGNGDLKMSITICYDQSSAADGVTRDEMKANAKLIAMAPTLAAENARLRAALEALVRHVTESHMCYSDCVENAREVLASLTT